MAFSFDSMTAYVEENRADLISKAILGAKTLGLGVDIRTGIKSSEKIPVLESTVPFQAAIFLSMICCAIDNESIFAPAGKYFCVK